MFKITKKFKRYCPAAAKRGSEMDHKNKGWIMNKKWIKDTFFFFFGVKLLLWHCQHVISVSHAINLQKTISLNVKRNKNKIFLYMSACMHMQLEMWHYRSCLVLTSTWYARGRHIQVTLLKYMLHSYCDIHFLLIHMPSAILRKKADCTNHAILDDD